MRKSQPVSLGFQGPIGPSKRGSPAKDHSFEPLPLKKTITCSGLRFTWGLPHNLRETSGRQALALLPELKSLGPEPDAVGGERTG